VRVSSTLNSSAAPQHTPRRGDRPGIARLPDRRNRVRALPATVPFRQAYQRFFKQK
jgi:hypothetical protein